jgi:hypothetical protein
VQNGSKFRTVTDTLVAKIVETPTVFDRGWAYFNSNTRYLFKCSKYDASNYSLVIYNHDHLF